MTAVITLIISKNNSKSSKVADMAEANLSGRGLLDTEVEDK
jgi:hypothetical protein